MPPEILLLIWFFLDVADNGSVTAQYPNNRASDYVADEDNAVRSMITYSIDDMEMVTVYSTSNDCTYEARKPALQIIDNTLTFLDREKTCGLCDYTTSGAITFNNDGSASVMGTETSKCGGAPAATYDFTVPPEKKPLRSRLIICRAAYTAIMCGGILC